MMRMDDWEDPFFEKGVEARARAFAKRRREQHPADRKLLLDYITPGLPQPRKAGGHG